MGRTRVNRPSPAAEAQKAGTGTGAARGPLGVPPGDPGEMLGVGGRGRDSPSLKNCELTSAKRLGYRVRWKTAPPPERSRPTHKRRSRAPRATPHRGLRAPPLPRATQSQPRQAPSELELNRRLRLRGSSSCSNPRSQARGVSFQRGSIKIQRSLDIQKNFLTKAKKKKPKTEKWRKIS